METSKYLVNADHKRGVKPLLRVNLRPYPNLIFMGVLGLVLVVTTKPVMVVFGLIILATIAFSLYRIKDRLVTEIYEDGVSVFAPQDQSIVHHLPWNEMNDWKFNPGIAMGEAIEVNMLNGEHFAIESFKSSKIAKLFHKYAKEKEIHAKVFGLTRK